MVSSGPRSFCCHECRRRKVKCDGLKPECRRCAKRGNTCTGYPSTFKFLDNRTPQTDQTASNRPRSIPSPSRRAGSDESWRPAQIQQSSDKDNLQKCCSFDNNKPGTRSNAESDKSMFSDDEMPIYENLSMLNLPFSPPSPSEYYHAMSYNGSGTISPSNTWTSQSPPLLTDILESQLQHTEPTTSNPTNRNTATPSTNLNKDFPRYGYTAENQDYNSSSNMTDDELEEYWKMLKPDTELTTTSDPVSYSDISNPPREQCGSTDCNPPNEQCTYHRESTMGYEDTTRMPAYGLYMSSFFM